MEAGQMGREQAVFSPGNIAANTTPGQPAIAPRPTEEVLPEGIAGPPAPATAGQPAIAPQINMDALRQQAAMTGVKGMEAYSTHLANEANRKAVAEGTIATRNQTAAIQMMGLQQRAREADQRSQDRALDRQARSDAQAEARALRREMTNVAASMRQPPAGVAVLGPDNKPVYVPRGQEIGKTPAPREPSVQIYSGSLTPGVDASGNPVFVQPSGREGVQPRVVEGVFPPKLTDKPMTEFQGKAALYGTRAAQSDKVLKALEDKINLPGLAAGQATGMIGNVLMSSEQKRVNQAQRDFVNAVLRQESGAVISDAEFANAKQQYFPVAGDDNATKAQKRANRELAIKGFARMSGLKGAADIQEVVDEPLLPGVAATSPTPGQKGVGGNILDQADAILNRKR